MDGGLKQKAGEAPGSRGVRHCSKVQWSLGVSVLDRMASMIRL